ncbi:MAG: S8 family serine peptidase [Chloroflexi bacterium]|nr:S8 family serine peptidase [Chloroflexota bacterium]
MALALTFLAAILLVAGSGQTAAARTIPSGVWSTGATQARVDEGPRPKADRQPARQAAEASKHQRIDSALTQTIRASQAGGRAQALESARVRGIAVRDGRVRVVVETAAGRPRAAKAAISGVGGKVEAEYATLLQALLPPSGIEQVAAEPAVRYVRTPAAPQRDAVSGEGVMATNASAWHTAGFTGQGVKVGIIDFGFTGYSARQAAGDLPAALTAVDYCGGLITAPGGEHGTAVAEVVYEMAPGAQVYLLCVDTEVQLGMAKDYAKANGISILVMSASWFNTSRGDGTGSPTSPSAIVADARASGILWVNSVGNRAQQHWTGVYSDTDNDGAHNFTALDNANTVFLPAGETTCISLKWDDWPASSQDYDLEVTVSATGVIVASSSNFQTGTQPPIESRCFTNLTGVSQNFGIWILKFQATAAPRFDLYIYPGPNLEYQSAAGSITEPGSSPSAFAVGAICWQNDRLESYSGQGPTIDGRIKPDIAGQTHVSSGVYGAFVSCPGGSNGQGGFDGTSAAAPHVAGAAALVKSANLTYTADQIQAFLEGRAVDLGTTGRDNQYGAGKLILGAAPGAGGLPAPTMPVGIPGVVTPPGPGVAADPGPYPQTSQYFPEDDTDKPRRLTRDERRQRAATSRIGSDDVHTEGNVLRVECKAETPFLVIGMRDGDQTVRLHATAREKCGSVSVGSYVLVEGVKEHEGLFDADELDLAD